MQMNQTIAVAPHQATGPPQAQVTVLRPSAASFCQDQEPHIQAQQDQYSSLASAVHPAPQTSIRAAPVYHNRSQQQQQQQQLHRHHLHDQNPHLHQHHEHEHQQHQQQQHQTRLIRQVHESGRYLAASSQACYATATPASNGLLAEADDASASLLDEAAALGSQLMSYESEYNPSDAHLLNQYTSADYILAADAQLDYAQAGMHHNNHYQVPATTMYRIQPTLATDESGAEQPQNGFISQQESAFYGSTCTTTPTTTSTQTTTQHYNVMQSSTNNTDSYLLQPTTSAQPTITTMPMIGHQSHQALRSVRHHSQQQQQQQDAAPVYHYTVVDDDLASHHHHHHHHHPQQQHHHQPHHHSSHQQHRHPSSQAFMHAEQNGFVGMQPQQESEQTFGFISNSSPSPYHHHHHHRPAQQQQVIASSSYHQTPTTTTTPTSVSSTSGGSSRSPKGYASTTATLAPQTTTTAQQQVYYQPADGGAPAPEQSSLASNQLLRNTSKDSIYRKSGSPPLSSHYVPANSVGQISLQPSRQQQEDYFDMRTEFCANGPMNGAADQSHIVSQDWLDTICRHLIEHMNQYGICVIDNFLGQLKGDLIFDEVQQLYNTGQHSKGRLVSNNRFNSRNGGPIRSDRVIWIDGYEDGCAQINNLIQTLCSVVTNSSRLSLYSDNALDKIVINKRTKAHVACYPGNGTRYIKHVDNPNGDGRVITAIYYLNKNWSTKRDGGLLRMFPAGMDEVANIEPLFDRVLFFWSDRRNPHEVLPAYRDRFAITVWYIGENRQT